MDLRVFIFAGLPFVAVVAFVLSFLTSKGYDKKDLDMIFSKRPNDSERRISDIADHFELVNGLTEDELEKECRLEIDKTMKK